MRAGVHVERSRQPIGEVGPTHSECGFWELWSGAETGSIQATPKCTRFLHGAGFESPARGEVAEGLCTSAYRGGRILASFAWGGSSKQFAMFQCVRNHERAMMRSARNRAVFVRDMDLAEHNQLDNRLEVLFSHRHHHGVPIPP